MKHKKIETSKLVLWICLIIEGCLLGLVFYGWLHSLMDAPQMLVGVAALIIATLLGYDAKSGFENVSKGKCGANLVPDLLTLLQGIFGALQAGDVPGAINSVISAMQIIVQSHPEFSQKDIPQYQPNIDIPIDNGKIQPDPLNNKETDNQQSSDNTNLIDNKGDS